MAKEIEIKIKLDDAEALYKKALSLGGQELKDKEGIELDIMYANESGDYQSYPKQAPKKVLRLRKSPKGFFLTYKEKPDGKQHDYLLERTEIETHVSDGEAVKSLLEKLGFKPYRIKEKYARKIKLDDSVLEFHKMAFTGDFLEIEGEEAVLVDVLEKLGLKMKQGINRDYTQLFYDYCVEHDLSIETPQTFEEEKKHGQAN